MQVEQEKIGPISAFQHTFKLKLFVYPGGCLAQINSLSENGLYNGCCSFGALRSQQQRTDRAHVIRKNQFVGGQSSLYPLVSQRLDYLFAG